MSCIYKIKESLATCTQIDKRLGEYILENKETVVNDSAQALAEKSKTSAAAVVRYAKKLGYKGFQHLKIDLAKDTNDNSISFDDIILEDDSIETFAKKAYVSNLATLEQTYNLLNLNAIENSIDLLKNCRTIYLVGVGASGLACQDLMHKLTRINRNVIYNQDFHVFLAALSHIQENDVLIAISYSGTTKEIIESVKIANAAKAKTIAITQFNKNLLSRLADINLYIPYEEKELRLGAIASRMATLVMTDLLYLGIARTNFDDTKAKIKATHDAIQNIR